MTGGNVLVQARVASGLSQEELARRAGTSQSTLSAYERGMKSPTLAVAERIIEAAGFSLELAPAVAFSQHPGQRGLPPFWVPDRLWTLEPRWARGHVHAHVGDDRASRRLRLADPEQRVLAYSALLRDGDPRDLLEAIDGNLLVDAWKQLDLPRPIRSAWKPLIADALRPFRRPGEEWAEREDRIEIAEKVIETRRAAGKL